MITAHPTKTTGKIIINLNISQVPCLNKTENKYDDKVYNLSFIAGKENPKIQA